MPFILVIGVAYAGYQASVSGDFSDTDDQIDLEGKASVTFLPLELSLGILESPISTLTFLDGNYNVAAEHLRRRVDDIVHHNPWLGGWIAKAKGDKEVKLWYDETSSQVAPGAFQLFPPGEIPLTRDTPYDKYDQLGGDAGIKVPKNKELIGKNVPLWKVSLIPDADQPDERFALVVSMSHMAGDGHTFYKLYNMLSRDAEIIKMNPMRRLEYSEVLTSRVGRQDTFYIKNAITNPLWEWTQTENNPIETRIFYISEEWLMKQRGDMSMGDSEREENVSKNSVIVSWFFNKVKATVGFMTYNFRDRLANCAVTDLDAGNYQNPIAYTTVDYATPELIQQSLVTQKRCGTDPPSILPGFQWDATFSVVSNWSSFLWDRVDLGDDINETLHIPLYDAHDLSVMPNKLSLCFLFTASPGGGPNDSKRRLGAFIVAPKSIICEIEVSDIVEEMISKF